MESESAIKPILKNKDIPPLMEGIFKNIYDGKRIPEFFIVSDLIKKGVYGDAGLTADKDEIIIFDPAYDNGFAKIPIAQIKNAHVKRLYGNAFLILNKDEAEIKVIRFTYLLIDLFEAVANYINHIVDGRNYSDAIAIIEEAFNKRKGYCPKCGRKLSGNNQVCLKCSDKNKFIKRIVSYVFPYKKQLITALVLSLCTTAAGLVPPYLTKELIDKVIVNGDVKRLFTIVIFLLSLYAFQHVAGGFRGYMMHITSESMITDLRNEIYRKAQYLPIKYFDKTSTGSVMNRITGDAGTLQQFVVRMTQEVVVQFFTMVGIIIIMFTMDWRLSLLSLIPVPFVVLGSRRFGKKIRPYYRRIWRRWSRVASILADTLPGIRVVKAFTNEERSIKYFNNQNADLLAQHYNLAIIGNFFPYLASFLVTLGSLVIWGLGGYWTIKYPSVLSVGTLIVFISYTGMFYAPVQFFANLNDSLQNAMTAAERIFEVLDAESESDNEDGIVPQDVKGHIELRNVAFDYEKGKKVLDGVSVDIQPGEVIGIVGTTGSGKSTIVNLLMRFYDDFEGEIFLDGVNIKDLNLTAYRDLIGYVLQDPVLFRDSIFNNIAYSNQTASVEEVLAAADLANAHEFIMRLPDGYDTQLGERGVGLSGGERQRISIARAMLKKPKIIILDEATASVDSETEHLIQQAIDHAIKGRTTIMIAHRLSTLRKADKIIVLEDGKIIEAGSHDELMVLGGKYYKLVQIQSLTQELGSIEDSKQKEDKENSEEQVVLKVE